MAIRIEVYQDDEMLDELEYEDRTEMLDEASVLQAKPGKQWMFLSKLGERLKKIVPPSDDEIAEMSAEEKQALLDETMEDMGDLLEEGGTT